MPIAEHPQFASLSGAVATVAAGDVDVAACRRRHPAGGGVAAVPRDDALRDLCSQTRSPGAPRTGLLTEEAPAWWERAVALATIDLVKAYRQLEGIPLDVLPQEAEALFGRVCSDVCATLAALDRLGAALWDEDEGRSCRLALTAFES